MRKTEGDESILEKLLDDHDVPDEALGFHLQQCVEKRLKAVLALHDIEYERTHSISYLTALLESHGIDPPARREQLETLHRGPLRHAMTICPSICLTAPLPAH